MQRSEETLEGLREIPFFQKLTGPQIEEIQSVSRILICDAGDIVFREGDPGAEVCFLLRGMVRVCKEASGGGERELARLGMNATLGEIAFLLGTPRTATVTALEACTLMHLARRDFDSLLNSDSAAAYKLAVNMARVLAARLQRMDEVIIRLLERPERVGPEDLADLLGGTVESRLPSFEG